MIPLRAAALHTAGLLVAFAAGWFLKPAPVLTTAGQSADGASRRTALPASLAGRPVGTAGETWLDAAAADAAAVRGAVRAGEANPVLLEKLGVVLAMADPAERLARWQALLPLMRLEDARAIRAMLRKHLAEGRGFAGETTAFWRRCGRMDPAAALAWSEEEGGRDTPDVLGGWACRDSAAALAWLRANPPESDFGPGIALAGLVAGLASQSPEAAVGLLLANGDDPLFSPCLGMAATIVIQRHGITGALWWFREVEESGAPAPFKSANLDILLSRGNFPVEGLGASKSMELAQTMARYAGEPWFSRSAASDLGVYMGDLDPMEGAAVMERFQDAEAKEYFMDTFLRQWLTKDAASVGEWLDHNRASPSFDPVASRLASYLGDDNPEAVRGWADQITDPIQKELLKKQLSGN